MRRTALPAVLGGLAVITLSACTEPSAPEPITEEILLQAAVTGTCDLVQSLAQGARSYFAQPEQRDAQSLLTDLKGACNSGLQSTVSGLAWQVLELVEAVLEDGRGGDPAVGSSLVNGLLACTSSLCESSALPGLNLVGALSDAGLFAVGRDDAEDALARGKVPFVDFDNNPNAAQWGVEVDRPWSMVTGANPVLVYGGPIFQGGVQLQELSVGALKYELDVYPDNGEFLEIPDPGTGLPLGTLHVGVCFDTETSLPPVAGADPGARMQREGILLEDYQPGFCPYASIQSASVFGPVLSLARNILPRSLSSFFFATKAGVIGGTPLDFSQFAPVAANTFGTLEFRKQPDPVVTAGDPIGEIEVLARSGNGTPMEKVLVTLTILNNNGLPAGAELSGDLSSYTQERDGEQGIATFPDDGGDPVTVGKAGGYRICADGTLDGFTFTQVCSEVFNARNSN